MKAADIIKHIASDRGINTIGKGDLDLVTPDGLNVHKREVWSLSITTDPEQYFKSMDQKYRNKTGYYYKFPVLSVEEGKRLCAELSENFGTPACEVSAPKELQPHAKLFFAVHIHPEFSFTKRTTSSEPVTQELVLASE